MLLTILVVEDESNPHAAEALTQILESLFFSIDRWKGHYEIVTATLSDEVLAKATGQVAVVNALLVRDGYVARSKGKYVWILPCFIAVENHQESFASLFDVLSMGMDVVGLCNSSGDSTQRKVELVSEVLECLPIAQQFEEFRWVVRRDFAEECFAKDAEFFVSMAYLSFRDAQNLRSLYAKVPFNMTVVTGITSHALLSLSLSFFSGTRSWQREVLVLPQSLARTMSMERIHVKLSEEQQYAFKHFLHSSFSALTYFSAYLFGESSANLSKHEAFSIARQVVGHLMKLSVATTATCGLVQQSSKLNFFLDQWQKNAAGPISSENVADPEAKKSVFDGIWWLGKELKDDFNRLGEQNFLGMVDCLRSSVELIKWEGYPSESLGCERSSGDVLPACIPEHESEP